MVLYLNKVIILFIFNKNQYYVIQFCFFVINTHFQINIFLQTNILD